MKMTTQMIAQEKAWKRKDWEGYWRYSSEEDDIIIHCKVPDTVNDTNGEKVEGGVMITPLRKSVDLLFTLNNLLADDWEEANAENSSVFAMELASHTL